MKPCNTCHQTLPDSSFNKDKTAKDGFKGKCKLCEKAYAKAYYQQKQEQIKSRVNAYRLENREEVNRKKREAARLKPKPVKYKLFGRRYRVTLFGPWIKVCYTCKEPKLLFAFSKRQNRYDGFEETCKKCINDKLKTRYHTDPKYREAVLATQKERCQRPDVKVKHREYWRERLKDPVNLAAHNERSRNWRNRNLDKARSSTRKSTAKWLATEKGQQTYNEWYANNPHKVRAGWERRRNRSKNAEGFYTGDDIMNLWNKQKGCCLNCRKQMGKKIQNAVFHIDHIYPISKGGTNWADNLQLLCPTCNWQKHAMLPEEFAQKQGRLFI
jgi:hypothetical protein